jgi:hypothetical protein
MTQKQSAEASAKRKTLKNQQMLLSLRLLAKKIHAENLFVR